jgi:hypothetical protein
LVGKGATQGGHNTWNGNKVDTSYLRMFGCQALMHVPHQQRKTWDEKSRNLIHVGYCEESNGYRLIDPKYGKLYKARNVVFVEDEMKEEFTTEQDNEQSKIEDSENTGDDMHKNEVKQETASKIEISDDTVEAESRRYPLQERVPKQFPDMIEYMTWNEENDREPLTVQEALDGKDKKKWSDAFKEELHSLEKKQTWKLVELPEGNKAIQ